MTLSNTLPVINEADANRGRLSRREMVARLLAGIGAGTVLPMVAAEHPIQALLANGEILEEADKLTSADWKPLVLSREQNESFSALAERIVPGSAKAQVNRFVDLLLSVDTEKHKKEFLEALAAFEEESQKRFGRGFPSLETDLQNKLLSDAAASSKENSSLHAPFENVKGWVVGAYYSSEIGMRELGWTEDRVFDRFPGCEHPEGHH